MLEKLKYKLLTQIMLWCAGQLFDYWRVHQCEENKHAVLHFAESERALNISIRTLVEGLDDEVSN